MKLIRFQSPTLTANSPPVPYTHQDFLRFLIANDQRFAANEEGLRAAARIDDALEADKNRDGVEVEDADQKLLLEAARTPLPVPQGVFYAFTPAYKLLPYIRDIEAAQEVKRARADNGVSATPSA